MKLYMCKTKPSEKHYCFVRRHGSPFSLPLSHGEPCRPVLEEYSADFVEMDLDENKGGLELPDVVGCGPNYLMMRKAVAEQLAAEFALGEHELIPIHLVNSKKRVHSDDYVAVNPLGKVDCLDTARSEMDDDDDDPAVQIFGKFWLKRTALPTDRDLFRVNGVLIGYMFSERLVQFIGQQGYTNFVFEDVQLS